MSITINSTSFDPFNHGTCSVRYRESDIEKLHRLKKLLNEKWGIGQVSKILVHDVGPKINSNNYKVIAAKGTFLLKASHLNNPAYQELINNCIAYCESKRVPSAHVIKTLDEKSFSRVDGEIYCLYDFIAGNNFDGSRRELIDTARNIAKLLTVLKDLPYSDSIRKKSTFSYHDPNLLKIAVEKAKASRVKSEVSCLIKEFSEDILSSSATVSRAITKTNSRLPMQVIHGDLHPHNMLFDQQSRILAAFLDFDVLTYSERVRAVAFAAHRLSRTYGEMTEAKKDQGTDIRVRIKAFLDEYRKHADLTRVELDSMGIVLQDEALRYITKILHWHYFENKTEWDFDLRKRITTLLEAKRFFS